MNCGAEPTWIEPTVHYKKNIIDTMSISKPVQTDSNKQRLSNLNLEYCLRIALHRPR